MPCTYGLEHEGRPPKLAELRNSRFSVGVLVILVYRRGAALSKAQLRDPLVLPRPWSQHLRFENKIKVVGHFSVFHGPMICQFNLGRQKQSKTELLLSTQQPVSMCRMCHAGIHAPHAIYHDPSETRRQIIADGGNTYEATWRSGAHSSSSTKNR